jgi:hypothetical protein
MVLFPLILERKSLHDGGDGKKQCVWGAQEKRPSRKLDGLSNAMLGSARDAAEPRDGLTHQIILM